jgi:D-glycero-D-manno-heptose 1,7-bisphosphate phosphatase
MRMAAFLDRDGVLNKTRFQGGTPKPPNSPSEVEILEGVFEAVMLLKLHGYLPVVVSNQPDVARGIKSREEIEAINLHIGSKLQIKHFYTCFHDDLDHCLCRKPAPGLISQAAAELQLDISSSFLVGDRWRDIAAGQAAGCKSFFIDYSYPERQPNLPYFRVNSLLEAAQVVIGAPNEI